jgi:hypothetical protein
MIRIHGKVTYADGRVESFTGGTWAVSQYERYAQRTKLDPDPAKAPMTWSLYIAYAATHRETWGTGDGFEVWSALVDDVEVEVESADPTPATTSDG